MNLFLYDSMSRALQEFIPIDASLVKMYVCGPTVYDRPHIGNIRSAVIYDMLYRLLKELYHDVMYVRNITDIDDKIIAGAKKSGIDIKDLVVTMSDAYHTDVARLGCLRPTYEPKATEHLPEMFRIIDVLLQKGHAYVAEGHVLFDVTSYAEYAKLSARNVNEMIPGARIGVKDYKKHPNDFVLWKPADAKEVGYASPWGRGRPGWHIECSAMSLKYLGEDFDIHGGGADLMFPHHENEIAQSKCAISGNFAKYWVHNGFLTVDGEKMSKSLNNFHLVDDVLAESDVNGVVLRYFYLGCHYRKPLDYNMNAINVAKKAERKIFNALIKILMLWCDYESESECRDLLIKHFNYDCNDAMDVDVAEEMRAKVDALRNLLGIFTLKHIDEQIAGNVGAERLSEALVLRFLCNDMNSAAALSHVYHQADRILKMKSDFDCEATKHVALLNVMNTKVDRDDVLGVDACDNADEYELQGIEKWREQVKGEEGERGEMLLFLKNLHLLGFEPIWVLSEGLRALCERRDVDEIPGHIYALAEKRASSKKNKEWATADALRDEVRELGYEIVDLPKERYEVRKI